MLTNGAYNQASGQCVFKADIADSRVAIKFYAKVCRPTMGFGLTFSCQISCWQLETRNVKYKVVTCYSILLRTKEVSKDIRVF